MMQARFFATFAIAVVHGGVIRSESSGGPNVTLPDGSLSAQEIDPAQEIECACHFGDDKESDGGGGDCSKDHMCPEATPNCTGYVYDMKWGKCTIDGFDPDADYESEWRESYANLGYNFDGYDTQGIFALDGCVAGCDGAWLNDGECDETCNVPECNYDGSDCPGGDGAQLPASLRRMLPLSPQPPPAQTSA